MFENNMRKCSCTKLYKYYSYNHCICDMFAPVLKNTLRFRSPFSFNDPYDCYIGTETNGECMSITRTEMETVYVCSLTKNYDNLLMWSHYASSHCGYVVEYDVEKLNKIKIKEWQIKDLFDVEYSDDIVTHQLLNYTKTEKKFYRLFFISLVVGIMKMKLDLFVTTV